MVYDFLKLIWDEKGFKKKCHIFQNIFRLCSEQKIRNVIYFLIVSQKIYFHKNYCTFYTESLSTRNSEQNREYGRKITYKVSIKQFYAQVHQLDTDVQVLFRSFYCCLSLRWCICSFYYNVTSKKSKWS